MNQNLALLKLLADETRLNILNILLREDSYVEKIACELSLTPATICYHLKKMESAGVVNCSRSQFYIIYSLNREIFNQPLYELIKKDEPVYPPEEKYKKEVLSAFGAHIFFDDQYVHAEPASEVVASAVVPYRDGDDPRKK